MFFEMTPTAVGWRSAVHTPRIAAHAFSRVFSELAYAFARQRWGASHDG
jgi:hypothetical protein